MLDHVADRDLRAQPDTFNELVAQMRADLADEQLQDIKAELAALADMASDVRQRGQLATLELGAGARIGDMHLHKQGYRRLKGQSPEERLDAFSGFTDFSTLGPVHERRDLLAGVIRLLVPNTAHLAAVIDEPVLMTPLEVRSAASPLGLPTVFVKELQSWSAWAQLDEYLERGKKRWEIVNTSMTPSDEHWEQHLVHLFAHLAHGTASDAPIVRIGRLFETPGGGSVRPRILRWACRRYASLGMGKPNWHDLCARWLDADEVPSSSLERIGLDYAGAANKQALRDLVERLNSTNSPLPGWIWFFLFTGLETRKEEARRLGDLLLQNGTDCSTWPWSSRTTRFVDRCRLLRSTPRFSLLAMAHSATGDVAAGDEIVRTCGDLPPSEFVRAWKAGLLSKLDLTRLPEACQMIIARRGIHRIVIDGNNLAYAGGSRAAGAQAELRHVTFARDTFCAAGFDVYIYFDSARGHWSEADWLKIHQWQQAGMASVTSEKADRPVIEKFLEDPEHSWLVARDLYRDHHERYPRLRHYGRSHRLGFHLADGRVVWEHPLDAPIGGVR